MSYSQNNPTQVLRFKNLCLYGETQVRYAVFVMKEYPNFYYFSEVSGLSCLVLLDIVKSFSIIDMGEHLEKVILNHAPEYWETGGNIFPLNKLSVEYRNIAKELTDAHTCFTPIKSIKRFQNIHDFGQFLVREQHLLHLHPSQSYYRVSTKNSDLCNFIKYLSVQFIDFVNL